MKDLSKSDLLKTGMRILGDSIFKTWSCYSDKKYHCGVCESCINRKKAFQKADILDKTKYDKNSNSYYEEFSFLE